MKENRFGVKDRKEYRRLWMAEFRKNNPEREKQYQAESRKRKRERLEERRKELMRLYREGKLDYNPSGIRGKW